jgi:hypothetical protein
MPARSRRPRLQETEPKSAPVETRLSFEDLVPSLREVALRFAEGNPARIRVLSSSKFEVLTEAELVRESVTVPAEKEPAAKTTRSRKPKKTAEPAEKVSD